MNEPPRKDATKKCRAAWASDSMSLKILWGWMKSCSAIFWRMNQHFYRQHLLCFGVHIVFRRRFVALGRFARDQKLCQAGHSLRQSEELKTQILCVCDLIFI